MCFDFLFKKNTIVLDSDETCTICLEHFTNNDLENNRIAIFLTCFHYIHINCLYKFILNTPILLKQNCPICRKEIGKLKIGESHFKDILRFLLQRLKRHVKNVHLYIKNVSYKRFHTQTKRLDVDILIYLVNLSIKYSFLNKEKIQKILIAIMTDPIILRKIKFIEKDIFYIFV